MAKIEVFHTKTLTDDETSMITRQTGQKAGFLTEIIQHSSFNDYLYTEKAEIVYDITERDKVFKDSHFSAHMILFKQTFKRGTIYFTCSLSTSLYIGLIDKFSAIRKTTYGMPIYTTIEQAEEEVKRLCPDKYDIVKKILDAEREKSAKNKKE